MAMTWQGANRVAAIAAAQAHGDLGIDTQASPVDVGAAIDAAGVALMYRPLPSLFGVYLYSAGTDPGIMVNNALTRAVRRHTAAHELGHHRFGHQSSIEAGADATDPSASLRAARRGGWSDEEKVAEAFASWFLMPRPAVKAVCADMAVTAPHTAAQAYQLALRLGTTFAATVRHLGVLRLISQAQARSWAAVAPATLKRQLAGEDIASTRGMDVWDLAAAPVYTPVSVASPGDVVVVTTGSGETCTVQGPADILGPVAGGWAARCGDPGDVDTPVTLSTSSRSYSVVLGRRPYGIYRPSAETATQATEGAV
ncbi:ImmA/IrrE family metallo-endopeptidase [Mycolicibacterium sp. 120266]|uniref:ImmA/IrrE family metallo-endopeptidase n=1 Tax=Mycolicibacterium sp. 120266 TaxID=3090601 RepID=UPI00299D4DED|nr:ImmA/IrrE family metallo-endopeptidase [Mycolicibacterium sp. 120266]MDX1873287.1 ImmA/IrrE family metallo-endopeptidase [Mycolicibacterium sp. 120266]